MSDCLIRGGDVYRTDSGRIERLDVLVESGRVSRLEAEIAPRPGLDVIDAAGRLVTPGLIDFHTHVFRYGHFLSFDADELAPRSGTTTFVDAGSAGALHFLAFRDYVIRPATANILAFLNVSAIGQTTDGVQGLGFHDNDDDRLLHLASAQEVIEKNRDLIVGVKVRAYTGLPTLLAMERARTLADRVRLPIMVHLAPAPPAFVDLLPYLGEGDIITHPYHGGADTILDGDGKVRPAYWEARARGIEVDLGLDRFHCDLAIMRAAMDQGFLPDYISSDLTVTNMNSITYDLPTTVTKVMACGMALEDALARCTTGPARKMGREAELGRLEVGSVADLGIFELAEGPHRLVDFFEHEISADRRLVPAQTLKAGRVLAPVASRTETLDVLNRANPWANY